MDQTGKQDEPLPCFRCGKKIERDPFVGSLTRGMSFKSLGGYGSAVYDPIDGRNHLRIDVCDGCVRERGNQGAVLEATVIPKAAQVTYERTCWYCKKDIVYQEGVPGAWRLADGDYDASFTCPGAWGVHLPGKAG